MKDFLSKQHCCSKMHTSLMENSASSFYRQDSYMYYSKFLPKNLNPPPSMTFQKSQPPLWMIEWWVTIWTFQIALFKDLYVHRDEINRNDNLLTHIFYHGVANQNFKNDFD